jgi:hypothetical protein
MCQEDCDIPPNITTPKYPQKYGRRYFGRRLFDKLFQSVTKSVEKQQKNKNENYRKPGDSTRKTQDCDLLYLTLENSDHSFLLNAFIRIVSCCAFQYSTEGSAQERVPVLALEEAWVHSSHQTCFWKVCLDPVFCRNNSPPVSRRVRHVTAVDALTTTIILGFRVLL